MEKDGRRLSEIQARLGLSHDLLVGDEEVYLSGIIRRAQERFVDLHQQGVVAEERLELTGWGELKEILERDGMVLGEDRELFEEAVAAREVFWQANYRMVKIIAFERARQRESTEEQLQEMEQEGHRGLLRAIDMYDPEMGNTFSTYAYWWIRQRVFRCEIKESCEYTVSEKVSELARRLQWVRNNVRDMGGDASDDEEIRQRVSGNMSDNEWELVKTLVDSKMVYLNQPVAFEEGDGGERGELIVDVNAIDPEEAAYESQRREKLYKLVGKALRESHVSERNIAIVEMRWGLGGGGPITFDEVAREFDLTRERVRQIEAKALDKIRGYLKRRDIKVGYFGDYSEGEGI